MPSSQTMSYKYNADGIRTQKTFTDNNQRYYYKHDYILDGSNIVAETITYFTYFGTNTTEVLYYYYDEAGSPTGIKYNGNVYYFQKNLQGDIIRILNSSGTIVATYTYDAWGNIIASTDTSGVSIGTKNPFRYRGYYYDTETGLYYLNSRYYDPQVGRFLNADAYASTGQGLLGSNMFAYCENNPINYHDSNGYIVIIPIAIKIATIIVGVVSVAHIANAAFALHNNKNNKNNDITDIVYNQHDVSMEFGLTSFAKHGCGAAATHNAIILAGGKSSLAKVVKYMGATDLTLGYGGVYVTNMRNYLRKEGYKAKLYLLIFNSDIDARIKNSLNQIGILAYKHNSGGHYIAIKWNGEFFEIYNEGNTNSEASINEWLEKKGYKRLS